MKNKIEQVTKRNIEIIDKFFEDVQSIIYKGKTKQSQMKMLYSARYWAEYMIKLNHNVLIDYLQAKV